MEQLLTWLLDLEPINLGDGAHPSLQWRPPVAPYLLFGLCVALAGLVILVSRHERATRWRRWVVGVLRGALIGFVVVLLCRPTLVVQRDRVEPSWVALLLDTSHSMARHERYVDEALAATVAKGAGLADASELATHNRLDLVRRALLHDQAAALQTVLQRSELRLAAFAGEVRTLGTAVKPEELPVLLDTLAALTPDGTATDLPGALSAVLGRQGAGRLAGVILASDARSTHAADLAHALNLARARQVPVLPLRIGSPHPPQDVSIGQVLADDNVFRDDLVAVRCQVAVTGLDQLTPIQLVLVDDLDDSEIARQTIELGGPSPRAEVEFRIRPQRAGRVAYRIEADPLPAEDETGDNAGRVEIQVSNDKLRVLYVEGYPRYEYRYLKNALLREETIESSCLLLSADVGFAQEGTYPVRRFPETVEELYRYDVVLLGDVDPTGDWLSAAQAQMLVEFVGEHGGGFGLIAGERHAPHRFGGTPLEKLIPVRIDPEFLGRYAEPLTTPFLPRLTAEGRHARCFRFDRSPEVSQQLFENLPGWFWVARSFGPKPGADVLLEHPGMQAPDGPMPLVVLGRYGAGRVLFLATDDTWRWRRHTGEYLHDIFWVQLARSLVGRSDGSRDHRLRLATDRKRYALGDRVSVQLDITDAELLSTLGEATTAVLIDAQGDPVAEIRVERIGPASPRFEAAFVPPQAGSFALRCRDIAPLPGDQPATANIRVDPADLEAQFPAADHDLLTRIATETGGQVVGLDNLTEAFATLRDRSVRIPDDTSEPLWDSKLALIAFVLLITAEWTLRKAFGMV